MIVYLFKKGSSKHFAELTVQASYVGSDPKAFLKKTAQNYANIRKEAIVVKANGHEDTSASPK